MEPSDSLCSLIDEVEDFGAGEMHKGVIVCMLPLKLQVDELASEGSYF